MGEPELSAPKRGWEARTSSPVASIHTSLNAGAGLMLIGSCEHADPLLCWLSYVKCAILTLTEQSLYSTNPALWHYCDSVTFSHFYKMKLRQTALCSWPVCISSYGKSDLQRKGSWFKGLYDLSPGDTAGLSGETMLIPRVGAKWKETTYTAFSTD